MSGETRIAMWNGLPPNDPYDGRGITFVGGEFKNNADTGLIDSIQGRSPLSSLTRHHDIQDASYTLGNLTQCSKKTWTNGAVNQTHTETFRYDKP